MSKKAIKRNMTMKTKKQKEKKNPRKDAMNVIKIIVGCILFLIMGYVMAALITGEYKLKDKASIDTSIILASATFKQSSSDYYVLYYEFGSDDETDLKTIIEDNSDYKFYKVNLNDKMNKNYVSEISNKQVTTMNDLMINGTTMIHIKDNANVEYIEGLDNIKSNFN